MVGWYWADGHGVLALRQVGDKWEAVYMGWRGGSVYRHNSPALAVLFALKRGGKQWIVMARNAEHAKQQLTAHGETGEGDRGRIRCAQAACRPFNACGKTITQVTRG